MPGSETYYADYDKLEMEISMKKSGMVFTLTLAMVFILTFTLSACGSEITSVKENNTAQSTADMI